MKTSFEFYNDYILGLDYQEDKVKVKTIEVDLKDKKQLFDIIKKKKDYKFWQPAKSNRRLMILALEEIESNKEKALRAERAQGLLKTKDK